MNIGARFGRLTVLSRAPTARTKWVCRCDCGIEKAVFSENLYSGHSKSCGCLSRERTTTHQLSKTREYRAWTNMRSRCENPNTPLFRRYGGRGISVCEAWRSFERFYADMGQRPSPNHSVDRIDLNGNYQPGNCRWATAKEQARNTSTNRFVTVSGEQMTLAEAVERRGINYSTVLHRLLRGDSITEALR